MHNQNSLEDDIRVINSERISRIVFANWQAGKTLRQIADETNLPIKVVERILNKRQKSLIPKGTLKQ